ncbi:MAG: TonB-dependent receptor [Flavobacteriaceae bacterium]|jgi:TonB-linked SusC/RagA family outer membrane protein|nr:TonB-dependent receptor [Flavobacteriaceae bacterium]
MLTNPNLRTKIRLHIICGLLIGSHSLYATSQNAATVPISTSISLNSNTSTIATIFKKIEEQTSYKVVFSPNVINLQTSITLSQSNNDLSVLLHAVAANTATSYKIKNNLISFKKNESKTEQKVQTTQIVKGKIVDQAGQPLPGAVIAIQGKPISTSADLEGRFSISAKAGEDKLVISFIGFSTKTITAQADLYIQLAESSNDLDEIVVVGYGTQQKKLVSTAIEKLTINQDNMRTVASPVELLQGRMAGVNINTSSGNLGTGERVSIRGISSISASNEPLYVVDGIPLYNPSAELYGMGEPMSSLSTLNLKDIESVEVLKDAAASAIYGSRANNGVIIITTKNGKRNSANMTFNFNTGYSEFANKNKLKISDSKTYIAQYNEGADNYNRQYNLQVGDKDFKTPIYNPFGDLPDTNWLDLITQKGKVTDMDLSFSGGSEKTTYYISGAYMQQDGVIKDNSMKRFNINTKLQTDVTPWLTVGTNNNVSYVRNNQVPGPNMGTTIVARAIEQRPFDRPYKPNGDYYVGGTEELLRHNPMQILNEQTAYLDQYRYIGNLFADIKIGSHISFKNSLNTDFNYTYDYLYYNEKHPYGTGVGRLIDSKRSIINLETENVLTYKNTFNEFGFTGMVGHTFQKVTNNTTGIDGRGFPSPSFDVINVASEITGATGYTTEYAMESYFSRISVDYLGKYMLNASLRTDGSSKFAPDTRWGWFPSISLGWNIEKERFMENIDLDAKLRLSYGSTGNQEGIGNYGYMSLFSGGKDYGLSSGIAVSSFGNNHLTWEKADQANIGLDLAFLQKRITLSVDAYQKKTNNLLYSMPIHATSGMSSILTNIGSMKNTGLEVSLGTDFAFGDLTWQSNFNIATNKNKITQLIDNNGEPLSIGGNRALQVGKDIGAFYLFIQDGIYQYDGEVPQAQYDRGVRAGDVRWKDRDNNGLINDNDREVVGSSNPDFFGGWNNSFRYQGFQLDVLSTFSYGNDVYAGWKPTVLGKIGDKYPVLNEVYDNRWTGPGSTNLYPRAIMGDTNNNRNSDRWLEDGSYFKIQSVTLSYTFDSDFLKKWSIKGLRVYTQATNLFLFTKYSGWDPSVSPSLDPRFYGNDALGVPPTRSYSIGMNINF